MRFLAGALVALVCVSFTLFTAFAVSVVAVVPGPSATFGDPDDTFGPPVGGGLYSGGLDVYTLGVGGSLTVAMQSSIVDGPGTDLIVSENPFLLTGDPGQSFAEACFVEVSSNNVHWARFPTSYAGPPGPFSPFSGGAPWWYSGFAGVLPVSATDAASAPDVVGAGGDAFDLADLADHPEVLAEHVDLDEINYVRVVDIDAGAVGDDSGNLVWDSGLSSSASADIDAFTGVNNESNLVAGRPSVELELVAGFLSITISDPDGFKDVKTGIKASANGLGFNFWSVLPYFTITGYDGTTLSLATGPIPPGTYPVVLKVGALDQEGLPAGDALVIQ